VRGQRRTAPVPIEYGMKTPSCEASSVPVQSVLLKDLMVSSVSMP